MIVGMIAGYFIPDRQPDVFIEKSSRDVGGSDEATILSAGIEASSCYETTPMNAMQKAAQVSVELAKKNVIVPWFYIIKDMIFIARQAEHHRVYTNRRPRKIAIETILPTYIYVLSVDGSREDAITSAAIGAGYECDRRDSFGN